MISKDKFDKIKGFKNDDSDFICKIEEYLTHEHCYIDYNNIYKNIEELKEAINSADNYEDAAFYSFLNCEFDIGKQVINIDRSEFDGVADLAATDAYYAGGKYDAKLRGYQKISEEYTKYLEGKEKAVFILDISAISSFPLWNTSMRRKMVSIVEIIQDTSIDKLTSNMLHKIIKESVPIKYVKEEKYDIDTLICITKAIAGKVPIKVHFVDECKTAESIHLVNEIKKFIYALSLDKAQRYDYIYDTVCKDMDEMFSVYGFCNFKNNMCVSQRHKNLFNRYPVPKTDGCCFKVVRKCEHNNKDGTCKVKCLPCKLFTCPYLGKISIGIRTSELILLRSFFNNRQKRISLYKFYNSKETLMRKIVSEK